MQVGNELLSGVAGITLLFMVTVLCITIILCVVFLKIPSSYGKTLRAMFDKIELLKLSTIFFVIMATTYLTYYDKLTDGTIAIFSGIAGYVLGTVRRGNYKEDKDDNIDT